jgi:hypothetical protein
MWYEGVKNAQAELHGSRIDPFTRSMKEGEDEQSDHLVNASIRRFTR